MLNKIKRTSRVKSSIAFALGFNRKNERAHGVETVNRTLRAVNAFTPVETGINNEILGFAGQTDKFMVLMTKNKAFRYDGNAATQACEFFMDADSYTATAYKESVHVSPQSGGIWVIGADEYKQYGSLEFESVANVGERIVGIYGQNGLKRLYIGHYGTNRLALNSTLMRYIDLQTPCQALASVSNNVLYALGETCYKIVFDANEENIKTFRIAHGLDEVVERSVAVYGNAIVFATTRGLYVLKNDKVTRIFTENSSVYDDYSHCRGRIWRDKYVLMGFNSEVTAYALDLNKHTCDISLPLGITDIAEFDGATYAVFADGTLRRMNNDEYADAYYEKFDMDFNCADNKYLRRLNVQSKYDVEVRIESDEEMRIVRVRGKRTAQSIPVYMKGRSFKLEVRSKGITELKKLELTADVYKEDDYGY